MSGTGSEILGRHGQKPGEGFDMQLFHSTIAKQAVQNAHRGESFFLSLPGDNTRSFASAVGPSEKDITATFQRSEYAHLQVCQMPCPLDEMPKTVLRVATKRDVPTSTTPLNAAAFGIDETSPRPLLPIDFYFREFFAEFRSAGSAEGALSSVSHSNSSKDSNLGETMAAYLNILEKAARKTRTKDSLMPQSPIH
ncbi:unnamed protein product, partial [Amoebophrya sp. A25]